MYLHFYPDREQSIIPLDNPSRWFPRSNSYPSTRNHVESTIFHDCVCFGPFFRFLSIAAKSVTFLINLSTESLLYNARRVDLMFLGSRNYNNLGHKLSHHVDFVLFRLMWLLRKQPSVENHPPAVIETNHATPGSREISRPLQNSWIISLHINFYDNTDYYLFTSPWIWNVNWTSLSLSLFQSFGCSIKFE